jgi:hypothetical protein
MDPYSYIPRNNRSGFNQINNNVNTWLKFAIRDLNENRVACPQNVDEADEVYDIVRENISSPFIGHSVAVHFHETLPKNRIIKTEMHNSIYNSISWFEGFSVNLKGLLGFTTYRGKKIGVDKIGHFFVEGWGFYKRAYLKGDVNIERAIKWGQFTERTYFGQTTTGVYSNADLVANFNGMRFWNHLLLLNKDPIGHYSDYFDEPLFSCEDSSWKMNDRRFSFFYYIDNAWDEERNCNSYDTENIEAQVKVQAALKIGYRDLKKRDGLICPLKKDSCEREIEKYGKFAKELLHESCFDIEKGYKVDVEKYGPNGFMNLFVRPFYSDYDNAIDIINLYSSRPSQ